MMNNIKYAILCVWLCGISACTINNVSPYSNKGYKTIQYYQKFGQLGHTDPVQRKKDVMSCGIIQYNEGKLDHQTVYPNMTDSQVWERRQKISNCMKAKGYVYDSLCTYRGIPTGYCDPEPCSVNNKWCE